MLNFVGKGGGLLHVNAGHLLGAHGVCAHGCVHTRVAAADNNYAVGHGGLFTLVDGLQKVDTGHDLFMPRPREDARHMPAGGNHQGGVLFAQFRKLFGIHRAVVHKGHAHVFNALEFLAQKVMVKTRTGNDLFELAAHNGISFVHGHIVSHTGKLPRGRKAAHAAADNANMLAGAGFGLLYSYIGRE